MPVLRLMRGGKNKGEIDARALAALFWKEQADHVFVEHVSAMPGWGSTSLFAFGKAYGIVIGVLAAVGVPISFVAPRAWKKSLHVPTVKYGARASASQLLASDSERWRLGRARP